MCSKLAAWFPEGSFARNVAMLTGGTAAAQGLAVIALPILTRLYTPEDFSLLAVYTAILGMATVISCLRYNLAIPLPEEDVDGMALLVAALGASIAMSLFLALPMICAPSATVALLGQPGLEPYLWLVPVGVFLASVYNALQFWTSRKKRFSLITRARITRAIGGVGTQVGYGCASSSPFGLLAGHMLFGGLGVIGLARDLLRIDRQTLNALTFRRIAEQVITYRRFPIWSVPEALLNTASLQVPVIVIAALSAGPEAGYMILAMRVMGLPMALIGSSVAQVFITEAPLRMREGKLTSFTLATMWKLFRVGALPLTIVGTLSPFIFPLIFGSGWIKAGWLVTWMVPWFLLQFVCSPISVILHVTGRFQLALFLQAFGLLVRIGPLLILAVEYPKYLAEIYSITGALFYGVYLIAILAALPNEKVN